MENKFIYRCLEIKLWYWSKVKLSKGAHWKCDKNKGWCIFQYFSWTDSIKPRLLFSNFVGSLYIRRIPFFRLFSVVIFTFAGPLGLLGSDIWNQNTV